MHCLIKLLCSWKYSLVIWELCNKLYNTANYTMASTPFLVKLVPWNVYSRHIIWKTQWVDHIPLALPLRYAKSTQGKARKGWCLALSRRIWWLRKLPPSVKRVKHMCMRQRGGWHELHLVLLYNRSSSQDGWHALLPANRKMDREALNAAHDLVRQSRSNAALHRGKDCLLLFLGR